MTESDTDEVSDLEILEAVAVVAEPIATSAEVSEQLPIRDKQTHDRLQHLSRNGLIATQQAGNERGWTLEMPGIITLERERE